MSQALRPIRYGMVGGGPGAFIGPVHRTAAALDGECVLVAGAFSSHPELSRRTGTELGLDPGRVYDSYQSMAAAEAELPAAERIEMVSIVTPNHLHFPVASTFLDEGIHVVCDKPLTASLDDALQLTARMAACPDLVFAVTHTYCGYPLVKEARERVRAGELGEVRKVVVEYSQGWLASALESTGHRQATWRTDPARAGVSSALGDIGTHAFDLVRYVSGLEAERLFADLGAVVPGRPLDDDATVLFAYEGGARGVLLCSQIATGERNHLRLRVYGTEGGLDWSHETPDRLRLLSPDGNERVLHAGAAGLSDRATAHQRLPAGHPEGYIEAFANIYRNAARSMRVLADGGPAPAFADDYPSVLDGAQAVHFVHRAVESARTGTWVDAHFVPSHASSPGSRT